MAACGAMTSDDFLKGQGPGLGPSSEAGGDLADEARSAIEVSGVIKWFDVSKGFGFIVPDSGLPDVLLHVTCLRRDGFQVAYEGARIVVEALQRSRGLQAFRVLSMDELDGHPSGADAATAHPCERDPDQRARAGASEVVQSTARLRLSDPRRRHARHLCSHGDPAPIRHHRIAAGAVPAGSVRARPERAYGR